MATRMRKRRISCEADMMEAEVENRSGGGGWGSDNTVFMEQTNYRMEEADTEPVRLVPVETAQSQMEGAFKKKRG